MDIFKRANMLIYIAGPYTKPDPVINTRNAIQAAEELLAAGLIPYIPHLSMLWHLVQPHDIEFWYEYDLFMLTRCDCMLRLPGESTGADREEVCAVKWGKRVFRSVEEIQKWRDHK